MRLTELPALDPSAVREPVNQMRFSVRAFSIIRFDPIATRIVPMRNDVFCRSARLRSLRTAHVEMRRPFGCLSYINRLADVMRSTKLYRAVGLTRRIFVSTSQLNYQSHSDTAACGGRARKLRTARKEFFGGFGEPVYFSPHRMQGHPVHLAPPPPPD
jgi:hypothetical protein